MWFEALNTLGNEKDLESDKFAPHSCQDHFNVVVQVNSLGDKFRIKSHIELEPNSPELPSTDDIEIIVPDNSIQPSTSSFVGHQPDDEKKIECLEAVINYTSELESIISQNEDIGSVWNANCHLVNLLEKVVLEWFERSQRHIGNGAITNELLIQKAEESKQIFCIQSVDLNIEWLNSFKRKYNITDVDMKMLRIYNNEPLPSLDIYEITLHVLKNNPIANLFSNTNDKSTTISNDKQAINHLMPLKEYVLLKDNYRAVGLISELMDIFSPSIKKEQE